MEFLVVIIIIMMIPNDLDRAVKDIKGEHPNDGEVMIRGQLVGQGICVTRSQLRR